MNNTTLDTIQILLRKGVVLGAAYLLHAGYITASGSAKMTEYWSAAGCLLVSFFWAKLHVNSKTGAQNYPNPDKKTNLPTPLFVGALAVLALSVSGCSSTVSTGHVVSITDRFIGVHYAQNTVNPSSPDIVFGFGSSTVVVMPTVTNQNLSVPGIANTFSMGQTGNTFMLPVVDETFASGNYAAGGASNNIQSTPIIAK